MSRSLTTRALLQAMEGMSPEAREATLRTALATVTRNNTIHDYPTPGALAQALDPNVKQTPALQLIDTRIVDTIRRGGRLIISIPPQEGKSQRVAVWTPIWELVRHPNARIVVASYAESLARRNAMAARSIIRNHGTGATDTTTGLPAPDRLGIGLKRGEQMATRWTLEGYTGGYYATGVGGSLTGQAADLLIIDDPLKNMVEADSAREREKVWEWWTSVALTRLAPGAAVIIIMTRWHEDDLAGRLITQDAEREQKQWEVLNIPAISEPGVPDALNRAPGEAMESARGRTLTEFETIRGSVGARTWTALYQGQPTPSEGGLFVREDLNQWRGEPPARPTGVLVSVDPADTGTGDEAGLITLGWDQDGTTWVLRDDSKRMTSATWSRKAILTALDMGAGEILYEAFTARETYRRVLLDAWSELQRLSRALVAHEGDTLAAAEALWADGYQGDALGAVQRVEAYAERIAPMEQPPFRLTPWTARGDKVARAAGARQGTATGRLRLGGVFPVLETQACTWQPGQGSPDRVDAMVNGYERVQQLIGRESELASPAQVLTGGAPSGGAFWTSTVG